MLDHPPERGVGAQNMVLSDDVVERLRAQPVRKGARGVVDGGAACLGGGIEEGGLVRRSHAAQTTAGL